MFIHVGHFILKLLYLCNYFVLNVFLYIYLVVWVGPASPVYAFGEGINALPLDPPMYAEKINIVHQHVL